MELLESGLLRNRAENAEREKAKVGLLVQSQGNFYRCITLLGHKCSYT